MSKKRLYAEITKSEKQDDGTIIVEGYASSGAVDCDGETVTPEAMKAAIPEYMKFANVREMHDAKKAAGVALEAEVMDDGRTHFVTHVVDPTAVLKVETGVYKGFSIGATIPKGGRDSVNKNIINAIKLYEVSLVDRPANPDAVFTCYKAEGAESGEDAGSSDDVVDPPVDPVQKGLWNMQTLLSALGSLRDACANVNYEVQNGDHTQKMADAIKECMLSLGEVTKKYLGEELAILAGIGKTDTGGDEEQLVKVTTERDELQKAATERAAQDAVEVAEIAKAAGIEVTEGMHYRDLLGTMLQKHIGDVKKMEDEVESLKKRAAAPKAFVTVSKGADRLEDVEPTVDPVKKSDGSVDEVTTLIKSAHRKPVPVSLPSR